MMEYLLWRGGFANHAYVVVAGVRWVVVVVIMRSQKDRKRGGKSWRRQWSRSYSFESSVDAAIIHPNARSLARPPTDAAITHASARSQHHRHQMHHSPDIIRDSLPDPK